jgi:hypothetical protein
MSPHILETNVDNLFIFESNEKRETRNEKRSLGFGAAISTKFGCRFERRLARRTRFLGLKVSAAGFAEFAAGDFGAAGRAADGLIFAVAGLFHGFFGFQFVGFFGAGLGGFGSAFVTEAVFGVPAVFGANPMAAGRAFFEEGHFFGNGLLEGGVMLFAAQAPVDVVHHVPAAPAEGAEDLKNVHGRLQHVGLGCDVSALESIAAAVAPEAKLESTVIRQVFNIPDELGQCHNGLLATTS